MIESSLKMPRNGRRRRRSMSFNTMKIHHVMADFHGNSSAVFLNDSIASRFFEIESSRCADSPSGWRKSTMKMRRVMENIHGTMRPP
jgi:hypothetical protein